MDKDLQPEWNDARWRTVEILDPQLPIANGDQMPREEWTAFVAAHINRPRRPLLVTILAHLDGLSWEEENELSKAVSAAGGMLMEIPAGETFGETANRLIAERSHIGTKPLSLIESLPIRNGPADWSPYKGRFLSDKEFQELQRKIRDGGPNPSVMS